MTGTSLDGLDVAIAHLAGDGLDMSPRLVRHAQFPFGGLANRLRAIAEQVPHTAADLSRVSAEFSARHATAIAELLGNERPDLICVHGQTVFHAPPLSWQMLTPAIIAHALGVDVVSDLRAADLACGGQGAPITPLADFVLFRSARESRLILNLGGFANFTWLPAVDADLSPLEQRNALGQIRGGDLCVCNHLLNGIARVALGSPFDRDGAAALSGRVQPALLARLRWWLDRQAAERRSLGTGDELNDEVLRLAGQYPPPDLARSACAALAATIAAHVPASERVLLAGGGGRNRALRAELESSLSCAVALTDEFGVPVEAREALEMAVLGALCADRVPITLPAITGVRPRAPIAGTWTFGERRSRLPQAT